MLETLLLPLAEAMPAATSSAGLTTGSAQSLASGLSVVGPLMGALGAIQSGFGSYYQARSLKSNLKYQSQVSALNARLAERTAESIMDAGEKAQGQVSLRAGKVKAAQKVGQAARGIQIGVGSAAEEIATTDLMKEVDMMTINANATRSAWAARTQGVNMANESLMQGTMSESINPYASAVPGLLESATSVASSWYRDKKLNGIADALGVQG